MNTKPFLLVLVSLLAIRSGTTLAQSRDPIGEAMISPQVIMQNAEELGLENSQREFIEEQMRSVQEKSRELQQNLQKEVTALAEVLKQDKPDEKKVLAQLDKVLDAEREIKHVQLAFSLAIRNKLTAQQITRAREIQQKMMANNRGGAGQPPESLRKKSQQVQELARKWQEDGKDLSSVASMMEELQPLMRNGKFKEAEEQLDKVIKALQEK